MKTYKLKVFAAIKVNKIALRLLTPLHKSCVYVGVCEYFMTTE